jgi:hypothetical protein
MDLQNIQKLIADNKQEEAKSELIAFFKESISESDKAAFLVNLASMQMAAENELSRQYIRVLKNALEALKLENTVNNKLLEKIDAEILRKKIQSS